MKFQIKVEYGQDELVKFYTEADVVDGIVRNYSFSSLVEDIRRACEAATSHVLCEYDTRTKTAAM